MPVSKNDLIVKVKIDLEFSLWTAIKIRIAGKNFAEYVEKVIKESQKQNEQHVQA